MLNNLEITRQNQNRPVYSIGVIADLLEVHPETLCVGKDMA
jgi:hypothetical protein